MQTNKYEQIDYSTLFLNERTYRAYILCFDQITGFLSSILAIEE